MAGFHNPYNFVPAPARTGLPGGLADGPPAGHHRWHPDRFSGEIDVEMRVITPLLVLRERPERGADSTDGHRELEVATTPDGRVDLAPTQIKGMLRAAYEAVTCSRFGVFDGGRPLGYRSGSEGAAELQPAFVLADDHVRVLGRIDGHRAVAAVELWSRDRRRDRLWSQFAHGADVEAVIKLGNHGWEAISLHRPGSQPRTGYVSGRHLVAGRLHAPGPTIDAKHNDAVFVTDVLCECPEQPADEGRPAVRCPEQQPHRDLRGDEAKALVDGLTDLIRHQRSVHVHAGRDELWQDGRKPWIYKGHKPGQTAWSRHLYDVRPGADAPDHLGPNTDLPPPAGPVTCWAEAATTARVRRLRPVQISRLLYEHPPRELLDPTLHPAEAIGQLSPADRVFGWVRPGRRAEPTTEVTAHRGQLRVVDLVAPPVADGVEDVGPVTIPPLSTPKPGQGRFYLGQLRNGDLGVLSTRTSRHDFFQPGDQRLRGRKVYPHHRGLEGKDVDELRRVFTYRPPTDQHEKARPTKDTQNATVHQWVRPGATFRFTLRITDLHRLELGALLWLLDPARCGSDDGPGRHRLGMGRPLGFGSVELTLAAVPRLHSGDAIRERLNVLAAAPDPAPTDLVPSLVDEFERALPDRFRPVVDALRWSLTGFPPRASVHYPNNGAQAPIYEWFSNNERTGGPRHPLPLPGSGTLPPVERP